MRTRAVVLSISVLCAVVPGVACDEDVLVLERRTTAGSGGGAAGGGVDSTSVATTGGGTMETVGGAPPVPANWQCSDLMEPVCLCESGASCSCQGPIGCELVCEESGCVLDCGEGTVCTVFGGAGSVGTCSAGSQCDWTCEGDCFVTCESDAACGVLPGSGFVHMFCDLDSVCQCEPGLDCECMGPGCPPL